MITMQRFIDKDGKQHGAPCARESSSFIESQVKGTLKEDQSSTRKLGKGTMWHDVAQLARLRTDHCSSNLGNPQRYGYSLGKRLLLCSGHYATPAIPLQYCGDS